MMTTLEPADRFDTRQPTRDRRPGLRLHGDGQRVLRRPARSGGPGVGAGRRRHGRVGRPHRPRGRGAVRPRLPPGGHRPHPRPLRPRGGAGDARAAVGRAGLRPPDGTALPDGPVVVPAARPVRRRGARRRPVLELTRGARSTSATGCEPLPDDGSVPGLPGWRWVFTPGHAPGHVALFRDADRTLIAGDAVVTTKQESAPAVMAQRRELHGPPMYFTPDWVSAARSVATLAELEPEVVATGHGEPLRGAVGDGRPPRPGPRLPPPGGAPARPVRTGPRCDASGIVSTPPEVRNSCPACSSGGGAPIRAGSPRRGLDAVKM